VSRTISGRSFDSGNDVSNVVLALSSLDQVGGSVKFVDIEEVALEAFKIAPDRFGWRTRKQFPSWERVRTAFVHANQNQQRKGSPPLVVSDTDGSAWRLTADGVAFVRENAAKTEKLTGRKRARASQSSQSGRRVREIRKHKVFVKFEQGTPISEVARFELADLLVCPPDSSTAAVVRKLDMARAAAVDVDDAEVVRFLGEVANEVRRQWS
jgi:hypothetical protein